MWSLCAEAKKSASRATSSGRATRPVGGRPRTAAPGSRSASARSRREVDSRRLVSTLPGQIAFTVIPCGASS
jgi:hypothetical protein